MQEQPEQRDRRRRVAPPTPSRASPEAVAAVHLATRAIFAATNPGEIVDLVIDLVRDLGGHVIPARLDPADALPIDLGLGEVDPLLAVAPAVSVARMHLETVLPALMEDARMAVLRLRNADRLADEANVDMLTGLLNRRATFRQLTRLTVGDSVVLIDLDHFKDLNDAQGHHAGDQALEAFGALLRSSVRSGDVVGRYGGEEFLVGMIRTTCADASKRVGEFRHSWMATAPAVTFSAGIAEVRGLGARSAVPIADRALYRAKAAGRDRWEVAANADY